MGVFETLIVGAIAVVVGIVGCVWGYGIWRFMLPIIGGVYGFIVGSSLVSPDRWLLALLMGVVIGLILAVLAYALWNIAAVLCGGLLGAAIGAQIALILNAWESNVITWVLLVVGFVIGLVLASILKDRVIMLVTAFAGAGAILFGLRLVLPQIFDFLTDPRNSLIALGIWLVLGVAGYVVQSSLFAERLTGTYEVGI